MKTKEEINEQVIKIDNEINNRIKKVGFFDNDFVELFKRWQKKENKYLDFDIGKVKFEIKRILSDNPKEVICKKRMGFTPKREKNGDINWFTIKDLTNVKGLFIDEPNTIEKTTMELVRQKVDKNNTGKSEKLIPIKKGDILVSFKLSVGIVKIYNSDKISYCNEAIDILTVNDGIYNKYVAYNCMIEYPKYSKNTNNGQTLNDDDKKKIKIYIPKSITIKSKEYSSYDIQKIIVEFLEYQFNISKKYREQLQYIKEDIEEFEKGLLPAVFNKNNEYIKQMFIKWNTNPSVPRKKEEMVDFTLDDIEFEEKKIGELVDSRSGSSKYTKEYYKNNSGNYPLMTGALDIVAYVKPIDENDIINEESVSYNKDNDAGSTAFYHTKPYIVGGHHYALLVKGKYKNKIYVKYFYYTMKDFFNRNKFYQSRKPIANISLIKEKTIKIPKSIITKTKEYPSYDIQKTIVSFIDRFYEWQEQVRLKIEELNKLLDEIDEAILYKAFKG